MTIIFDLLKIIGALGFFIYGMKVMSEGIQKVAGAKMRSILGAMTSNRFLGILTGISITALVQSSSATTVMTVSFVNAGLLSLTESFGVIMGANIGTTITGWLISIFGFKVKIDAIALPIIGIGFPLMFSNKSNLKSWAEVLIGFAFLFMGLSALKESVPDLNSNPAALDFIAYFSNLGLWGLPVYVIVGTLLTIIVQSSSAAMALTIVLCDKGLIPFEMAAGIILGENIGTTITANLAALVANVHAKRAARAHFIINVFGVIWMMLLFQFFIKGIETYMLSVGGNSPFTDPKSVPIALSLFHTSFNLINVSLLIWFVPLIEKVVIKMVPSKGEEDIFKLDYISNSMMPTTELSILEVKKELAKFGKITAKMPGYLENLILEREEKHRTHWLDKMKHYEEITDRVEEEVSNFISNLSTSELSAEGSNRLRAMLNISNELERIGDLFYSMSLSIDRKNKEKIWFSPEQRNSIIDMLKLVNDAFSIMLENLNKDFGQTNLKRAMEAEELINEKRDELRSFHHESIESGEYNVRSALIYNDLFSSCEKVGDHIMNITESLTGKI